MTPAERLEAAFKAGQACQRNARGQSDAMASYIISAVESAMTIDDVTMQQAIEAWLTAVPDGEAGDWRLRAAFEAAGFKVVTS